MLPLLYASFVAPLGNVTYRLPVGEDPTIDCTDLAIAAGTCIEKQVGFAYAINWWPTLAILLPFALFFAFSSVQNMQRAFARMLDQGMFCDTAWTTDDPTGPSRLRSAVQTLVRRTWVIFLAAATVIATISVAGFATDWYCVVQSPLAHGKLLTEIEPAQRPALCQNTAGQEIDWSIAAIFPMDNAIQVPPDTLVPTVSMNMVFSGYVYALALIGVTVVLAYFCFVFALAITVSQVRRGTLGLRLIPNVTSPDSLKRMGFETFEPVLQPCVVITVLSFIIVFLTRLQNEYLRSDSPGNIFAFMFEGVSDIVGPDGALRSIKGLFDVGQLADPNSQIGGPVMIIVFALVSVVLAFILRRTAQDAAADVRQALADDQTAPKVEALYGLDRATLDEKLSSIATWPLSWPRLRQMLMLAGFGIACFFFYKLAIVWIAVVLVRMLMSAKWSD